MDQIPDSKGMSHRAFAQWRTERGKPTSHTAVRRAIMAGRLRASVRNGKVIDPELADREWEENTSAEHRERATGSAEGSETATAEEHAREGMTKSEADAVAAVWKARRLELEFKQAAGELVAAAGVRQKMIDAFTAVRTRLLGVPSRAKQTMPELSVEQITKFEDLIREALTELVDG